MASCIQDEEERCRLCLEGEDDGPLVQPCACRGSGRLAHSHCLERWRRTSPKQDAAYRCGQCRDEYRDALSLELLRARLQAERATGRSTRSTLGTLAAQLQAQGKWNEAGPLFREVLEVSRETLGSRHQNTLTSISNLGIQMEEMGDLAAAELLYREALEVRRETLGNRHPSTLNSVSNLGGLFGAQGDLAAAEPLYREALRSLKTLGRLLRAKRRARATPPPGPAESAESLLHKMGDLAVTEV